MEARKKKKKLKKQRKKNIIESIELSLMKSISFKEREILSELDNQINDMDKEYRDFIVFSMNRFMISYISTEKGNMLVDISMESTSIKDMETLIISKDNPKGDILINKEFQNMIQMHAGREREERLEKREERHYAKKRNNIYGIKMKKR